MSEANSLNKRTIEAAGRVGVNIVAGITGVNFIDPFILQRALPFQDRGRFRYVT